MAGASLLTLLDDIATLLDDVALMTKKATAKTAGVLGDAEARRCREACKPQRCTPARCRVQARGHTPAQLLLTRRSNLQRCAYSSDRLH